MNYEIGQPDTTEEHLPSSMECEAESKDNFFCTRELGHEGSHAGGDGETIVAVWP